MKSTLHSTIKTSLKQEAQNARSLLSTMQRYVNRMDLILRHIAGFRALAHIFRHSQALTKR